MTMRMNIGKNQQEIPMQSKKSVLEWLRNVMKLLNKKVVHSITQFPGCLFFYFVAKKTFCDKIREHIFINPATGATYGANI